MQAAAMSVKERSAYPTRPIRQDRDSTAPVKLPQNPQAERDPRRPHP